MHVEVRTLAVVTAADGSFTGYMDAANGLLDRLQYVKTDFADGSTFTITSEDSGETLWAESSVNASTVRAPRQPTHSTAGVASLYAAAGTAVQDKIAVNGRIKVVIASGGNVKSATFRAFII